MIHEAGEDSIRGKSSIHHCSSTLDHHTSCLRSKAFVMPPCHVSVFLYEPSYAQFVFSLPNQLVWVLSRVDSCPTDEYLRLSSTFLPARGATAIPSVHQKKGIMRRRRGCCNASDLPPMIENLGVDIPWSRSSDVHSDMQPGAPEHEHVQT